MAAVVYAATGKRKTSVARVRLMPGTGNITVNGKDVKDYFNRQTLMLMVRSPLVETGTEARYDVIAHDRGRRQIRPGRRPQARCGPRSGGGRPLAQDRRQARRASFPRRPYGGAQEGRPQEGPQAPAVLQALSLSILREGIREAREKSPSPLLFVGSCRADEWEPMPELRVDVDAIGRNTEVVASLLRAHGPGSGRRHQGLPGRAAGRRGHAGRRRGGPRRHPRPQSAPAAGRAARARNCTASTCPRSSEPFDPGDVTYVYVRRRARPRWRALGSAASAAPGDDPGGDRGRAGGRARGAAARPGRRRSPPTRA